MMIEILVSDSVKVDTDGVRSFVASLISIALFNNFFVPNSVKIHLLSYGNMVEAFSEDEIEDERIPWGFYSRDPFFNEEDILHFSKSENLFVRCEYEDGTPLSDIEIKSTIIHEFAHFLLAYNDLSMSEEEEENFCDEFEESFFDLAMSISKKLLSSDPIYNISSISRGELMRWASVFLRYNSVDDLREVIQSILERSSR